MSAEIFSRTAALLGEAAMARLFASCVAVFGIGGVGSFAAEGLARGGVGHIVLIDSDVISPTNINRQIHATTQNIGQRKTEVMAKRLADINPQAEITAITDFYTAENAAAFFSRPYDYIVDAIDTVPSKLDLICQAKQRGIPIISSMGTGNKLDPTRFQVTDISHTQVCPLARAMRKRLRERGITELKVVYSPETPLPVQLADEAGGRRPVPGSVSFVPPVAGLIIAGEVIKALAASPRSQSQGTGQK